MELNAEIDWNIWGPVVGCIVFVVVVIVAVLIYCCCCRDTGDDRPIASSKYNNRYLQHASGLSNYSRYPPPDNVYIHRLSKEYTVGDKFMNKHVAMTWEMPSKNRKQFADEKARGKYSHGLPEKYSIILVDNKERFCQVIVDEARQNAHGQSPFTTNATFKVVNFRLNGDHFNFDQEGQGRLVLRCNKYNEICHIDGVEFLY